MVDGVEARGREAIEVGEGGNDGHLCRAFSGRMRKRRDVA